MPKHAEYQLMYQGHLEGQASNQGFEVITFRYIGATMS